MVYGVVLAGCAANSDKLVSANDTNVEKSEIQTAYTPQRKVREIDIKKEINVLKKRLANLENKPTNADSLIRGLTAFHSKDFVEANFYLQHALKFDPQNPHLHKLNALSYHLRGNQGDTGKYKLASVGYNLAHDLDPGDSSIPYYHGILKFSQGQYKEAQNFFASAILVNANISDYYFGLAASSYYVGEVQRAYVNIRKARKLDPDNRRNIQASGMIFASLGAFSKAENDAKLLKSPKNARFSAQHHLKNRIADWHDFYVSNRIMSDDEFQVLMAQATDIYGVPSTGIFSDSESETSLSQADISDDNSGSDSIETPQVPATVIKEKIVQKPKMALIDVTIIRTEEIYKSAKGVNLFEGLNLFFKNKDSNANAISILLGATGSGIAYSLNIFNDNYDRNEVIARPTIVVQDGETSRFFSGGTTHVVLEGGSAGSGSIEPIDDGVKLQVRPKFIDGNTLTMAVVAERTSLESNLSAVSSALSGTSFARTSKTKISANLTLEYGQTMVLSGLSDQAKDTVDQKAPGLGDIPIAQYLFRNNTKTSSKRTVLILLTPRRAELANEDGSKKMTNNESDRINLANLEQNNDWLTPSSNLQSVVYHLNKYKFFNQYRKGDIMLENWANEGMVSHMLDKFLQFLYIRYNFDKIEDYDTPGFYAKSS